METSSLNRRVSTCASLAPISELQPINRMQRAPAGRNSIAARTRSSRRYLELVRTFESELGRLWTEADRVIVKQVASLSLQGELLEAAIVGGSTLATRSFKKFPASPIIVRASTEPISRSKKTRLPPTESQHRKNPMTFGPKVI
jgi:hypothetical protein